MNGRSRRGEERELIALLQAQKSLSFSKPG